MEGNDWPINYNLSIKDIDTSTALITIRTMFERGKIIKYLLAEDDSLMKKKLIQYYDEPMEKYLMFLWTRLKRSKLKNIGNIDWNIPDPDFIEDKTHQYKEVNKPRFTLKPTPLNITR